jgi:hypothetical protein
MDLYCMRNYAQRMFGYAFTCTYCTLSMIENLGKRGFCGKYEFILHVCDHFCALI